MEDNYPIPQNVPSNNIEPRAQDIANLPKQKSKLPFIIAIIVFLILTVGASAYYLGSKSMKEKSISKTQTSINTTVKPISSLAPTSILVTPAVTYPGWKTYSDHQYYVLQYPPTWVFGSKFNTDAGTFGFYDPSSVQIIGAGSIEYGKNGIQFPAHYINFDPTTTTETLQTLIDHTNYTNSSNYSQGKINGYDEYITGNAGEGYPSVLGYVGFITNGKTLLRFQTSAQNITGNTIENKILNSITLLPVQPK